MQKKCQSEEYLSSHSKPGFWENELIIVPPIQNINSFSNMVANRLTICRFTLTLNIVSGKDSEPTDCNPVWQGKEFPPDPSH